MADKERDSYDEDLDERMKRELDKGINDMESGRELEIDAAFDKIEELRRQRRDENKYDSFMRFGDAMKDGRLTEPSNGKIYRLREAILKSKQLGRPLTEEEMAEYEIDEADRAATESRKRMTHEEVFLNIRNKLK